MANQYGYKGAEKNRRFSPEQVSQMRQDIWTGKKTAAYYARLHGIGVETIRRLARGETYADVGWQPPEWEERSGPRYAPAPDPLAEEARASADRLVEALRAGADQEGGDSVTERLLADIAQARVQARVADELLEELQAAKGR